MRVKANFATRLKTLLRDTLFYKTLPFALRTLETFEAQHYNVQKKTLKSASISPKGASLFLYYGRGGGADRHAQEAAAKVEAQGTQSWMLNFHPIRREFILRRASVSKSDTRVFKFPSQYATMVKYLQTLGLAKLHIQHTRYLPYCFLKDLSEFAGLLGVPYDYMMHDFIALCPRVHLINKEFEYCGMPQDASLCNACINDNGTLTISPSDVGKWRKDYAQLLKKASALMAPSHDTAERHKQILGDLNIEVTPHDATTAALRALPVKKEGELVTVAVIGRIHRYKGAGVLLACARDAQARALSLHFTVIGDSIYAKELREAGVAVTGVYQENELPERLAKSECSLVFLPSVWPETYSYVLSHIWEQGYFPVVFDIGAPAERVKAAQNGMTLPLAMIDSPTAINDALLKAAYAQHQR